MEQGSEEEVSPDLEPIEDREKDEQEHEIEEGNKEQK